MDAESEAIRQQVEETKSQLVEKLETLEQHVADTVQTAGATVNATVETVHETVESVTGAVQDAVKSVGNVFDVRGHVNAHPWMAVGGAAAFGFLMARHLSHKPKSVPVTVTGWSREAEQHTDPQVVAAAVRAAYESGMRVNSPWRQLKLMAVGAVAGLVQDVASRAAAEIWRQINDRLVPASEAKVETSASNPDDGLLQIHGSEGIDSDNPWQARRQQL
jgi:ElaB/YqjD/DUF883 family membrane-anchored ribosome-binding protein